MIIYKTTLKRIILDKLNLIFMVFMPVILITLFTVIYGFSSPKANIGIVKNDNSQTANILVKKLAQTSNIKYITPSQINSKILNMEIVMAITIDENFTEELIKNNTTKLKTVNLQETNVTIPLKMELNSLLNVMVGFSKVAKGDKTMFYNLIAEYNKKVFTTKYSSTEKKDTNNMNLAQIGFLVISMLYLTTVAAKILIEDKNNKVFYRIVAAPIKISSYMVQIILSLFTISVAQVLLIFGIFKFIFNTDFNGNILSIIVLSLVFCLLSVSLGVAINNISKDSRQAGLFMTFIITPFGMLGGCFWPAEFMPDSLRAIAKFVPTTWIMDAFSKLLSGKALSSTLNNVVILMAFTFLFSLLAIWKKTDIAK